MTDHLAKSLVLLSLKRSAFERRTELTFQHVESRFDVAPLHVSLDELGTVEIEIVIHAAPR